MLLCLERNERLYENLFIFICLVLFVFCGNVKDTSYTGSTPAATEVRSFLGISLTDSIDFIRWKLSLSENQYALECHYGIGKPNTNGFINGGKHIQVNGLVKRESNRYLLTNKNKSLALAALNSNLLHILDSKNHLLAGTSGWSYALNNLDPTPSDQTAWLGRSIAVKDSTSFVGRTPCGVAGFGARNDCYKLKWSIVFYKGTTTGKFWLRGSPWYKEGGKRGTWKIAEGKDHRISYLLNDDKGKELARLLSLDENVLVFTDTNGNLLVGNLDFSYTLNRRW